MTWHFRKRSKRKVLAVLALLLCALGTVALAQKADSWRSATLEQLEAVLPARAPVEKERIETEMRTATGVVDDRGHVFAAVVLITAGYAADGKYSHYLLVQAPVSIGEKALKPGAYVVGWKHAEDGLSVHIFDAATGTEQLAALAKPLPSPKRVESFRIFPPAEHHYIQIGRYALPYSLGD